MKKQTNKYNLNFRIPKNFLTALLASFVLVFISFASYGEEHAAAPSKEEGGDQAEGGKKESGFLKKDEYLELNASVEQLNSKIRSKNETIKKLLLDKEHIKNPTQFREIIKQIQKEYKELTEMSESVEKKKTILKFQFPDKGFVKHEEKGKVKDLEEISGEAAIEVEMSKLSKKIETHYGESIQTKESQERKKREPAQEHSETEVIPEEKQNSDDFSHTVILKK